MRNANMAAESKKPAKLASSGTADKSRDIALAAKITRHECACGCGALIPLKDLYSIKSIGGGHARMKYYVRGHETRPPVK
jgi:hypothetical protein